MELSPLSHENQPQKPSILDDSALGNGSGPSSDGIVSDAHVSPTIKSYWELQQTPSDEELYCQARTGVLLFQGYPVHVGLGSGSLSWAPEPSPGHRKVAASGRVAIEDIVSATSAILNTGCKCLTAVCSCEPGYCCVVDTFSRGSKAACEWSPLRLVFSAEDPEVVQDWVQALQQQLAKIVHRPRRLLVFLNPTSGAGRGKRVWADSAQPLLSRAGVRVELVVTQEGGQACGHVASMPPPQLLSYDGLLAVGGDGLFAELVAAMMTQQQHAPAQHAEALRRLRLGHIPAGSTDAVAYSLHGTRSASAAALHAALGDRHPLDVACLAALCGPGAARQEGPPPRHFVCMASCGFMGEMLRASEDMRWAGTARYDLAGALQYVRLPCQQYSIWLFGEDPAPSAAHNSAVSTGGGQDMSMTGGGALGLCRHGCTVCLPGDKAALGRGAEEEVQQLLLRPAQECGEAGGWRLVQGRHVAVMVAVTACRSARSRVGAAPAAHLADGRVTVALVRECGRAAYLRFLLHLSRRGLTPGAFPFVEVTTARAVQVRVEDGPVQGCQWNVDGELLTARHVSIAVQRAAVDVFARSVEA